MSELKAARKRLGLSIRQVADALSTTEAFIKAIERGDLQQLPAGSQSRLVEGYRNLVQERVRTRSRDLILGDEDESSPTDAVTDPLEPHMEPVTGTVRLRGDEVPVLRLLAGSFLLTLSCLMGFKLLQLAVGGPGTVHEEAPVVSAAPPEVVQTEEVEPAIAEAPPQPAPAAPAPVDRGVHNLTIRAVHPVKIDARLGTTTVHAGPVGGGQVITVGGAEDITVEISDLSRVQLDYNGGRVEPLHNLSSARRLVFVRATP